MRRLVVVLAVAVVAAACGKKSDSSSAPAPTGAQGTEGEAAKADAGSPKSEDKSEEPADGGANTAKTDDAEQPKSAPEGDAGSAAGGDPAGGTQVAKTDAGPAKVEGDADDSVDKGEVEGAKAGEMEPEWPLAQLIVAAKMADEEKGWEHFYDKVLHSNQKYAKSPRHWRAFAWKRMRRQWTHYLADDDKLVFKITDVQDAGQGRLKIFLHNELGAPTPCFVAKDPEAKPKNAWRVYNCSL